MAQDPLGSFKSHFIEELSLAIDLPTYQESFRPNEGGLGESTDQGNTSDETLNVDIGFEADLSLRLQFGRYQVLDLLGKGSFGFVYRAYDRDLDRQVAVKVIRSQAIESKSRERFLSEARVVAALDHPSIVPVFDVGQNDAGDVYIVSKLIDGLNLQDWLKQRRPNQTVAMYWCYAIASALDHAHSRGLVHRDVKPANILISSAGKAFLTDFGIALRTNSDSGAKYVGTPSYMSPEQARGESHRVDQRSDVFSLGVVLFELISGRRPVECDDYVELMRRVGSQAAPSLGAFAEEVPTSIVHICDKALAFRASERFQSSAEMAMELRDVLTRGAKRTGSPTTSVESLGVSPKGLRSFDAIDAEAYFELIPGSRSSDGRPDNIRRWQARLFSKDSNCSIGLLYGPSGCGKSSFVKAGLIPSLPAEITAIFVEASSDQTEKRIATALRKRSSQVTDQLSLVELFSAAREGRLLPQGQRLLVVIDQFEQWLHSHHGDLRTELSSALRHCDGSNVSCLLLIRDDFWLSISRFLRELDIEISPQNSELFDLFDVAHAVKVLGLFGKALGKLPKEQVQWTESQRSFLTAAVQTIAVENKVSSVRLSLLAELLKSREWAHSTLALMGGSAGIGVTFLRECFDSPVSPAMNRKFREPVKEVLRTLLPNEGTEIKGHSRNTKSLALASGLQEGSDEFRALLNLLDRELRLITPTDTVELPVARSNPLGESKASLPNIASVRPAVGGAVEKASVKGVSDCEYQLAHDYLVPSLREWLSASLKKSSRGRMQLLLSERAAIWAKRRENRHLPSFTEFVGIRFSTSKRTWSDEEAEMMRQAWHRIGLYNLFFPINTFIIVACFAWLYYYDGLLLTYVDEQYQSLGLFRFLQENWRKTSEEIVGFQSPWQDFFLLFSVMLLGYLLFTFLFRSKSRYKPSRSSRVWKGFITLSLLAIQAFALTLLGTVFVLFLSKI